MIETLFVLNTNITPIDAKDGIEERVTQVESIISYILADAANGEANVKYDNLFSAIWLVERLVHEIGALQGAIKC
jgi:hypothetical protein